MFVGLVLRGALLELITLGFYRFWLATDIRRHLWSHTSVGGDSAEYTGRARELLIGFLVAMAILVPIYIVYFLIGLEAERMQAFASIPLVLFLYLFSQFARYRARRYRVTRTVWRGLRFSMGGSGSSYAWRAGLWGLAVVLTLGLALPWRQAALERYSMRHTAYGTLQGKFDGSGGWLFKRVWFLWLLAAPAAVLIIPIPFLYGAYKAIEWRWWISHAHFGDVRFQSNLDWADLIGLYLKIIGWFVLLIAVLSGWFMGMYGVVRTMVGEFDTEEERMLAILESPFFLLGSGVGYLLMAVMFGAVIRLYLSRDLWAAIAASTTVLNLGAADDVTGQGAVADPLGEGFADSLDIGGF